MDKDYWKLVCGYVTVLKVLSMFSDFVYIYFCGMLWDYPFWSLKMTVNSQSSLEDKVRVLYYQSSDIFHEVFWGQGEQTIPFVWQQTGVVVHVKIWNKMELLQSQMCFTIFTIFVHFVTFWLTRLIVESQFCCP